MNDAGVAKRYAQALFMLACESQQVDKIGQRLGIIGAWASHDHNGLLV